MSEGETGVYIIFLDVDGVLNTTKDHRKMNSEYYWVRQELVDHLASIIVETDARVVISSTWRFSPEMSEYIREEVAKGLQRKKYSNLGRVDPSELENPPLEKYDDVVIGVTPDLSLPKSDPTPLPESSHQTRTDEILLWLKENAEIDIDILVRKNTLEYGRKEAEPGDIPFNWWLLDNKISVKNFVCLDDMNLHYYSCYRLKSKIKDHLVLTKTSSGLGPKHVQQAIDKLKTETFDLISWANNCFVACDRNNCIHKQKRDEKKFLEDFKRSSLNFGLEIPIPSRSKTVPANMLSMNPSTPQFKPKKLSAEEKCSSGYDVLL